MKLCSEFDEEFEMSLSCEIKIYYSDTDCGGVVYYANYLVYFEKARTQWMEERGAGVKELAEKGVLFIVSKAEVQYKSPARYGDVLTVETQVDKIGAARIIFTYRVLRKADGKLIASGNTDLACISKDLKPCRIPPEVLEKIRGK